MTARGAVCRKQAGGKNLENLRSTKQNHSHQANDSSISTALFLLAQQHSWAVCLFNRNTDQTCQFIFWATRLDVELLSEENSSAPAAALTVNAFFIESSRGRIAFTNKHQPLQFNTWMRAGHTTREASLWTFCETHPYKAEEIRNKCLSPLIIACPLCSRAKSATIWAFMIRN